MEEVTLRVKRHRGESLPEFIPVLCSYKKKPLTRMFAGIEINGDSPAFVRGSRMGLFMAPPNVIEIQQKLRAILVKQRGQQRETRRELSRALSVTISELHEIVLEDSELCEEDSETYRLVCVPTIELLHNEYALRLSSAEDSEEDSLDSEDSNIEGYYTNEYPDETSSSDPVSSSSEYNYEIIEED